MSSSSLFKKKPGSSKTKKNTRRRALSDDEDEEEAEASIAQSIQGTKKKRKLLADLQYQRGVNPQKQTVNRQKDSNQPDEQPQQPSSTADGVIATQHQQAMEDFIRKNLNANTENSTTDDVTKPEPTRDLFYTEISKASAALLSSANKDDTTTGENIVAVAGSLVGGGTGLEEVILPPSVALATEPLGHTPSVPSQTVVRQTTEKQQRATRQTAKAYEDDDRPGFDAIRRKAKGAGHKDPSRENLQATDDKVWKRFMTRQREKQWARR